MSARHSVRRRGPAACGGAMLLLLMFLVAVMGILLAVTGGLWHTAARRDKEAQLLFVGNEYRRALQSYRAATPPGLPTLPERLEQLLLDQRQQVPARHLRRLYRDPITEGVDWGLVKEGGRIAGVYSLGAGVPLKDAGFPQWATGFAKAGSYAAWTFLAETGAAPARPTADSAAAANVASSSVANPPLAPGSAAPDSPTLSDEAREACGEALAIALEECKPRQGQPFRLACRREAISEHQRCVGG